MSHRYGSLFRVLRKLGRAIFPTYEFEPLPDYKDPVVYVSHHNNMIGPVSVMLWIPEFVRIWALGVFFNVEECFEHYRDFTFTKRFGLPQWLATPLAWIGSRIVSATVKSARAIPVYRQSRQIIHTLKESVDILDAGQAILLFPDTDYSSESSEVGTLYEGFLNLDKYYHRKTGNHLNFVPLYSDVENRVIVNGAPIRFNDQQSFIEQRGELAEELANRLNALSQKYKVKQLEQDNATIK